MALDGEKVTVADSGHHAWDAEDGGQTVLTGDHPSVRQEPAELGDQPGDDPEQRRPGGRRTAAKSSGPRTSRARPVAVPRLAAIPCIPPSPTVTGVGVPPRCTGAEVRR